MNKLEQAHDTIRFIREQADESIFFNSCGKDSLVTLDLLAPYFRKVVVCVHVFCQRA